MNKKQENRIHKNLKWIAPLVAVLVVGSFVFGLGTRKEQLIVSPEAAHPASNALDLSALPALASDVNLYNKNNVISVGSGYVQITHANGQEEGVTTQSAIVAGDRILVSDDGSAEILWFDGSVTRLAADTDIEILQASYDASNINKTKIDLWADRGKIWAKVIGLIDGESEFQIKSTNAIAGVRGTTFNYILENTLPTIEVIEGVVSLKKPDEVPSSVAPISITSGQTGSLKEDGEIELRSFDSSKLNQPYYQENIEKDRLADDKFQEANLEKIKQWAEPLPGSPDYPRKEQLIQAALSQAKDPLLLDSLKTRVAKIKMYETIALSDQSDAEATLKEISDKIQKAEWPEAQSPKIKIDLENGLKHIKRALGPVEKKENDQLEFGDTLRESQIQIENSPKEVSREKTSLRPASDRVVISDEADKILPSTTAEPKQTEKAEKIEETTAAKGGTVETESISSSKGEVAPTPELIPEEKHEEVLEKIRTNRDSWAKRVEARLQRETKNGEKGQEEIKPDVVKDTKGSQEPEQEDERTWAEKRLSHEENATPDNAEINEGGEGAQGDVDNVLPIENIGDVSAPSDQPGEENAKGLDKPRENQGQGNPPSNQPAEDGAKGPNMPKEDKGQDKPRENQGQGNPPSNPDWEYDGIEAPTPSLPAEDTSQVEPSTEVVY